MSVMKYQVGPMSIFSHIRWEKKACPEVHIQTFKGNICFCEGDTSQLAGITPQPQPKE